MLCTIMCFVCFSKSGSYSSYWTMYTSVNSFSGDHYFVPEEEDKEEKEQEKR